jgi:hypothetical protein
MRKKFTEALVFLADLTGRTMTDQIHNFYLKELEPIGLDRVIPALLKYASKAKWPSVDDIRQSLGINIDPTDNEANARILAQKVVEAIGKFGWNNQLEAEKWFGKEEWEIVTKYLPWSQICDIETDQIPIFQAQFREFVIAYNQNKQHQEYLKLSGKNQAIVSSLLDSKIQKQIDEIPF